MTMLACQGCVAIDLFQQGLAGRLNLAKFGVMGQVDRLGLGLHDPGHGGAMGFGIKLAWGAGDERKGTLGAVELAVRDAKSVAGEDGIGALINNKNMVKGMAWRIPKMNLTRAKPERECFRGFNQS